ITFSNNDQNSIEVIDPNQNKTTLAASALAASGGLSLSGNTLSGSIPLSTPAGTYQLILHAKNTVSYAAAEASITFNVNTAGYPTFDSIPTTLNVDESHPYTSTPLLDIAQYVNSGMPNGSITNITATLTNGDSLTASGLTFTFSTSPTLVAQITGTPNALYAGQSKTLHITATNSANNTTSVDVTLVYRGLPVRNGSANPTQTQYVNEAINPIS
ncbi:MAG: hypothetical protein UW69_C0078G0001, partial [Microgenomates group bacterium GW2011_GWA2_44_7]